MSSPETGSSGAPPCGRPRKRQLTTASPATALTDGLGERREPFSSGVISRALEIPPDTTDVTEHRKVLADLNVGVQQKHQPSEADLACHPSMHRTDTLEFITCVRGEIYLVTDTDEVLMQSGDTVVIRGTNHAWSNRANEPCLLVGTMIVASQR